MARRRKKRRAVVSNLSVANTKAVAGEVEKLLASGQPLTAQTFLERARDDSSPLHSLFEWDDAAAAEKFRLDQAGQYIRCIRIVEDLDGGKHNPRLVYSIARPDGRRSYEDREVVKANSGHRSDVLGHLYETMMTAAKEAESLEPDSKEWRAILNGVLRNPPIEYTLLRAKNAGEEGGREAG